MGYRKVYDTLNLTTGLGINHKIADNVYNIDYGFILNTYIGSTHIVSIHFLYGQSDRPEPGAKTEKQGESEKEILFKKYYDKASSDYQVENYDTAFTEIKKALNIWPKNYEGAKLKNKIIAGQIFAEGKELYNEKDYDGAINKFESSLDMDGSFKKAQEYLSKARDAKAGLELLEKEEVKEEKEEVKEEEKVISFCTECGKKLPKKDLKFCPYCGKKLK